jgi:hypothetical protein
MAQETGNAKVVNFCKAIENMGRFDKPDYTQLKKILRIRDEFATKDEYSGL